MSAAEAAVHAGLLACPACASSGAEAPLATAPSACSCARCGRIFPWVDDVPCLVPDPVRFRFQELYRLRDYELVIETQRSVIVRELDDPQLLLLTRQRLHALLDAMAAERELISDVLAPLFRGLDVDATRFVPGSPDPGRELGTLEMYETVFRDWGWGELENARALGLTRELTGRAQGQALGRLAVLGAGACRLAADVHEQLGPTATYAIDHNPLPLLIASRLLRGTTIDAFEYPVAPRGQRHAAVLQRLAATARLRPGLSLMLADARALPFAPGKLDSVLTPWFVDVVGSPLPSTIAMVNRALRGGGLWLNQGPLRFDAGAARRYSIEEVLDLVRLGGFEMVGEISDDVPYFHSPFSGARRIETVYGFVARKVGGAEYPATLLRTSEQPNWLTDPRLPIPLFSGAAELRERLIVGAGALSLVDGERSLADIASALGDELGAEPARLVEPLRSLLSALLLGR